MSTTSPTQTRIRYAHEFDRFNQPPLVSKAHGFELDESMPLHQLALDRMSDNRDLKLIITAEDSETGVGKTTLAGWLAMNWSWIFGGEVWSADQYAMLSPYEYFQAVSDTPPGTVLLVDDAEELDSRRSMQDLNVKFSWWWELMRLKQIITIITLPSPASIDSRLEELADVWINIQRRGVGLAHDIGVHSYGSRGVYTEKVHNVEFPDVSDHEQMKALQKMKEEKMDEWEREARGELEDEDENLGKTAQTFLAVAKKEQEQVAWADVADLDDRLEYSGEYYRQQTKELLA